MDMQQLRDAFATENVGWFQAVQIVRALRDPTPITEAGLRELGFELSGDDDGLSLGGWFAERFGRVWRFHHDATIVDPKSIGQLRGLLLFVGE